MQKGSKWSYLDQLEPDPKDFARAGRSTFLRIDLEAIWRNIQIIQARCASSTQLIAVVKANAYGHGSVGVAKYLNKHGLFHFAVATASEGKELRENGVVGYIQVLGSCVEEDIDAMLEYNLTPTATNLDFIEKWALAIEKPHRKMALCEKHINQTVDRAKLSVVIKVDTGMSRNGCQCDELSTLMDTCDRHRILVHSIMTHFAQSWDDPIFTQEQLARFLEATKPYRDKGVKVHAANSNAIYRGVALDLDYVRPGAAMYGLPADTNIEALSKMQSIGFRPVLSWLAKPCMIKSLEAGRAVGYDQTYRLTKQERIATFSFGYADGYNRLLSDKGILTDLNGKVYKIVGLVSMDSATLSVDDHVTADTLFYVIRNDYMSPNSASSMAKMMGTITDAVMTSLSSRLPRIYVTHRKYCS